MTIITGAIKFVDVPQDFCLTNITQLIKFIQTNGKIELDASQLTNVYVGVDQPTDTSVIWYAISSSGNFLGVRVYVQSQWLQVFPAPSSIYRIYGNSSDIPPGYALINNATPGFTAAMVAHLQAQWLQATSGTDYVIFDVVYVGL